MTPKTTKLIYWIVTLLFAIAMLMDGIVGLMRVEEGQQIMIHLGYPIYIMSILGTAKVLGALAVVQTKYSLLKEWAYAGFTFHFLGACASRAFAGDSFILIVSPLIFLSFQMLTYYFWKKVRGLH
ncbi:MAG: DoxX family protein [Spirosomataceae bacterium]